MSNEDDKDTKRLNSISPEGTYVRSTVTEKCIKWRQFDRRIVRIERKLKILRDAVRMVIHPYVTMRDVNWIQYSDRAYTEVLEEVRALGLLIPKLDLIKGSEEI